MVCRVGWERVGLVCRIGRVGSPGRSRLGGGSQDPDRDDHNEERESW